ncbi:hypothetical protein M433DRAFT_58814 [Acidomyces richmondensis BFW]|nr:MAG: hypothetical protein FE78DRAFT_466321 [Acidomyces sp. 'richmondensis']KYG49608.1 hypothetical protein M433DRAFT_58814 [Acidomyces richmondensis BFW]
MSIPKIPMLADEEIDDLLYFARVDELQDLEAAISDLARKYDCQPALIIKGAVDPETGNTIIHYCSANGFFITLKRLLELLKAVADKGAVNSAEAETMFINRQNSQGNTPLHWAAYNGHLHVVKALIESGADMWIKNQAGHLAMFEAERAEKNEVVQYMLEAGGRKVEQAGTEGVPTADEEVDMSDGEGEAGPSGEVAAGFLPPGSDVTTQDGTRE